MVRNESTKSPSGSSSGWPSGTVELRPWTRPAERRASATVAPMAQPPDPSGKATGAPAGARSSAKPPCPSTTSEPTRCADPPSISARRAAAARSREACRSPPFAPAGGSPMRQGGGVDDRLPAGAPAQVGGERRASPPLRRRRLLPCASAGQAHHDSRRAEAALAGAGGDRTPGPARAGSARRAPRAWSPPGRRPGGPG